MDNPTNKSPLISETFLTITLCLLSFLMLIGMALDSTTFESDDLNHLASSSSEPDLPYVIFNTNEETPAVTAIQTERQLFAWPSSSETEFIGEGNVSLDEQNRLQIAGGNLHAVDVEQNLLGSCRSSNELSLEVTIIPTDKNGDDYKSIITFHSDNTSPNFQLGQQGSQFVFQLRTTSKTEPSAIHFGEVIPGQRHHLLMSYRAGTLICFLNGRSILKTSSVKGELENWQPGRLVLGGQEATIDNWHGSFELLSIHGRTINRNEAFERYDLASTDNNQVQ